MATKLSKKLLVLAEIYGDCRAEGLNVTSEHMLERLEHMLGGIISIENELKQLKDRLRK